MTITAAADGSALGNPGPAGWAWYIDDHTWRAGGWPHGTNNMGELKAVLDLLEATAAEPATAGEHLLILCDSQYVINSVTKWMPGWKRKGWKKKDGKPVQNVELMQAIDAAMQGRAVDFEWVKGHAGHPLNEAADKRANAAATAYSAGRSPETGPGLDAYGSTREQAPAGTQDAGTSGAAGAADTTDAAERELALYADDVRGNPEFAEALLHPDLCVVDSAGRVLDRREYLASLAPLRGFDRLEISDVITETLSDNAVLVRSTASGAYGTTVRTSLWVRDGSSDPHLVLRHHQQTVRS
ncbi:ribonuclease HI family protein [Corynebacterium sp.]|uniref:ribonuclease HI family protein n=1 Tax=Corynebacterium sp. TaxID=1720 RepID=UPI0028B10BD6|nr:ribonuclease HI family protein [Corynebacterium sp.]